MKIKNYLAIFHLVVISAVVSLSSSLQAKSAVTILTNDDFKYGTYIIDKPGVYKLGEDISFNPNSPETLTEAITSGLIPAPIASQLGLSAPVDAYSAGSPLFTQFTFNGSAPFSVGGPLDARYDPAGFGLGFFAALVIQADNVVLNLNGHTIEQSAEHALLQRFFAVIELAEQPFIPNQGPADFGSSIESANNVIIKNGIIGRSAHHGIHGNNNSNIKIKNVDFIDYEVAAVALNGVKGLKISRSNAVNRKDVPIIGTFSSGRFIKDYLNELVRKGSTTQLNVNGQLLSAVNIQRDLRNAINNAHEDIIVDGNLVDGRASIDADEHPVEYALFHNKFGVVDGNSYSFLTNKLGVAVNGFPTQPSANDNGAENIWLSNVHVHDQHAFINEIVTLNQNNKPVIDPVGSVFQTLNTHPDTGAPITVSSLNTNVARYIGNPIANAQAFVAKAFLNNEFSQSNLDLTRLNITATVLNWIEGKPGFEFLNSITPQESSFFCNGDSMFHVNKGVIGFKMDAAKNVVMRNTSVNGIKNLGALGSEICGDYSNATSHPQASLKGYGGAKTRGYSFSGSKHVFLVNSLVTDMTANEGSVTGIDVFNDTQGVFIKKSDVVDAEAGLALDSLASVSGPNDIPTATGFRIADDSNGVTILKACAELLNGLGGEFIIDDQSDSAFLYRICR